MNSILKQIKNEWKANAFLFIELMVVFAILWYIVDWVFVTGRVYFAPMGFDTDHCYELTVSKLDAKSPLYDPELTPEDDMDAFIEIAERLRHRPGVEHVAISQNSIPYNDGSNGFTVCVDTVPVNTMRRWIQPEFFQVFQLQGVAVLGEDGRTVYTTSADSLAWALRSRPEALVLSKNFVSDTRHAELGLHDALPLLGRSLPVNFPENDFRMPVTGICQPMRWSHFETSEQWGGPVIATDLPRETMIAFGNPMYLQLSLRVSPDADGGQAFMEALMDDADRQYRVGNVFLLDVQPFDDLRYVMELEDVNEVRTQLCILGFLLLNIFLGVIGTFWFRTQHRRQEVALRMAMGSTRRGVFARLMGEGLLLLSLAAIPALLIAFNLGLAELVEVDRVAFNASRFLVCIAAAWALMALMIVVGIWYPAGRAMQVQPAEALHDE